MHIAFDGGCFQQGILGGIYQVARGFLNAAKELQPDLRVTLVCDTRQGPVREEALAGLSWRPDVLYRPVARSYDPPEPWPATRDPQIRFFVDGEIVDAVLSDDVARYVGPTPRRAFAILSRAAAPADDLSAPRRGLRLESIEVRTLNGAGLVARMSGSDRRLVAGFVEGTNPRWTDGAGFLPLAIFADQAEQVEVAISYSPQDSYALPPGPGADTLRKIKRNEAAAERVRALEELAEELRAGGCNAYFANHFTPLHLPGIVNVAWAYDIIPVLFPQYFHTDAKINFDENLRIFAMADRIYAISDCTRDDVVANLSIATDRIITAGIAINGSFAPRRGAAVEGLIARHGLHQDRYIIAVATIEPRKNHMRLLMAYAELRRRIPHCPDLLLVGTMGWDFDQVLALRADSGLENSVKILSNVAESDLVALYSGALFSVYISVYEGFGLPIVEAMASGCPVLTSDRSSMAEVAIDAALLANPYDIDGIADAMQRMVTDGALRKKLRSRGLERARHYAWNRSSRIILDDLATLQSSDRCA